MKAFSQYLREQAEAKYEVGQEVSFIIQNVSKYVDADMLGGFDHGKIENVMGDSLELVLPNNNKISVKTADVFGLHGADGEEE